MQVWQMEIRAFIGYIWKSHRALVLFSMAFIASIQLLLIYFYSTLDIAPMVEMVLRQIPGQFGELFGKDILSQVSTGGTIAFGLEHPLVITLITFIGINLVSKNISSNADNRLMEIILAHPFRRETLISTLYIFSMFILFLLILAACLGAGIAIFWFHEPDWTLLQRMLLADLNAWLLHVLIMSYTLFFSVLFQDISKAIRFSAVLALVFYFVDIISNFWDFLHFTKYVNFFSYFDPAKILSGHEWVFRDMGILAITSAILFVLSYRNFVRKDII